MVPGIRRVSAQIEPYTRYWTEQNHQATSGDGPLLIAIGDSTALGIGASSPDRGYVGLLRRALDQRDGATWRVANLAQSGARVDDGVERQLPLAEELLDLRAPTIQLICCIGTNDVVWSASTSRVRAGLETIIGRLPEASSVGLVAGGSPRARLINRAIRHAADDAGCDLVDPWREPGPPAGRRLAADRFHPNDLGYALMARPFARQLDAPDPAADLALD